MKRGSRCSNERAGRGVQVSADQQAFDRAAQGVGAKVIRTAVRAPNMNAVSERFVGSVRRELLDHVRLLDDEHLATLLHEYRRYFHENRPHQGIGQGGVTYDDPAGRDR